MSAKIRRYVREKQDFEYQRGYDTKELQASSLRKDFLKKFIIDFDTNLFRTQQERDWAYIAKREYNYDIILKSLGYAVMIGNVIMTWRIYVRKAMVWWPLFTMIPVSYLYLSPLMLQKHNKKLFDMCNLGNDFYLGQMRNQVLKKCNIILNTEDF